MKITDVAIQNRKPVYLLLLILITVGLYCYSVLPRESNPDIAIPYIFVTTPYEGVAPSDIETLITLKIEKKLKGLSDVEEIRSVSSEGLSFISVEFKPGIEIDVARQRVRDKVDEAKPELPTDIDDPSVEEMNFSEFPILIVSLYGMEDMGRLKKLAENVQDEIETIQGVLSAEISGDLEREIRVEVDLDRLNRYNLRLDEVIAAIQEENVNVPSGSLDIGEGRFLVRVPGEFESPEEVYSLPVSARADGSLVYLSDITRVSDTFKDVQSIARINGEPCVILTIKKRAGENAIYIADAVKELLEGYRFPAGVGFELSFDESRSIKNMVSDLENSIISGLLLVVLVIFLFMGLKNAVFVGLSIPYSMCITFAVLQIMGITLNTMVLFALVLVLGMFVDNSVVIVENIYRHMGVGKTSGQAASEAAREVGWPVITSTLTTVAAFFPMLFWPGIMGEFMSYLPLVVIIALLASLFIAIVINPAIAAKFMHYNKDEKAFAFDLSPDRGLLLRYRNIVSWAVGHSKLVIASAFGFLVFTFVLYGLVGKGVQFFPETDPRRAFVIVEMPEGTNINRTDSFIREIETYIQGYPEIISYSTVSGVGASTGGNSGSGNTLNRASISIDFVNKELRKQSSASILSDVRKKCKKLYGADIEVKGEEDGPPSGKPINVEVSGDKYETLEEIAARIKEVVKTCDGTVDVGDDYEKGKPEFDFRLDRKKAFAYGLSTARAALVIKAVVNGIEVGKYREGDDEYDITVRAMPEMRADISTLENIKINNMAGTPIALSSIGRFTYESGSGAINRIDNRRVISVFSEVEGRLASDILTELEGKLKGMALPEGYTLSFTGENEEQEKAQAFLGKAMLTAVFLIGLILVSQFNSYTQPFIILSSVVLSIAGVLWGLLLTGAPFGVIMTGIGIISLAGVVVNNAIVLIDYTNLLVREGGRSVKEAAIESGIIRFRPVVLTAVTTVLGLVPMALGISIDFVDMKIAVGTETSQYWGPMASAIIAGLLFATVLTLVVVPCLYVLLTRDKDSAAHASGGPGALRRAFGRLWRGVLRVVKRRSDTDGKEEAAACGRA